MGNLDKSTIAMIMFLVLVAMFLILIIATIAVIISKSRQEDEEEYVDEDMDNIEVNNLDEDDNYSENYTEEAYSNTADDGYTDSYDDGYTDSYDNDYSDSYDDESTASYENQQSYRDDIFQDAEAEISSDDEYGDMSDSAFAEDAFNTNIVDEPTNEIDTDQIKESSKAKSLMDNPPMEIEDVWNEDESDDVENSNSDFESLVETEESDAPEEFETPEQPVGDAETSDGINYEAIAASVREAEEIGVAIKDDMEGGQPTIGEMFGINEAMSKFGSNRDRREQSYAGSDEEFYWFNRDDVESRPSHRKPELYYHYFSVADECIEDLLVEMYDCAVVRTEEIRYIAYGIEPKSYSMKQIMSAGFDANRGKKKSPSTQDLVKIYEKWCVYVDNLFTKIELHADENTVQMIRQKLCDYGRSDVDVLLEGK